jgi:hypothetical protein
LCINPSIDDKSKFVLKLENLNTKFKKPLRIRKDFFLALHQFIQKQLSKIHQQSGNFKLKKVGMALSNFNQILKIIR